MGGVARCVNRFITWVELSVSVGDRQAGLDFESVTRTKRSVERVGTRTCEGIFVCNTWEV